MAMEQVRARLLARRAALSGQVARIEEELRQPMEQDFAEQAVDREDDEALDAVERSALSQLSLIDQALARIDAGDYGLCENCGQPIAPARLEAVPEATRCIACAGAPRRPKLSLRLA
jgi:DnaK suppressor protein